MISDQISQLIDQVKQHPNGETRNSLLGRLKDARAHAIVLEREEFMADGTKSPAELASNTCICPAPGVVSSACTARVHKLS